MAINTIITIPIYKQNRQSKTYVYCIYIWYFNVRFNWIVRVELPNVILL